MLVVIRCPKCRAAARVDESDLGQTVQCPRCEDAFAAVEEAELVAPGPKFVPTNGAARDLPPPSEPRRLRNPPSESLFESFPSSGEALSPTVPAADPDSQYDPHAEPQGALPASVVVGLALLPFLIPILWLIAPVVLGVEPVLSLASALALAFSASVLCLAVIYTVDWRPGTRLKGVLLLVVLSYITGVGIYFLKKEWVDRVRKFFGAKPGWSLFQPPEGGYRILLPGPRQDFPPNDPPPTGMAALACHQARQNNMGAAGEDVFTVGSGKAKPPANPNDPVPGTDPWFDKLTADIAARAGGAVASTTREPMGVIPGRQVTIKIGNDGRNRVVEVYYLAAKNRVFYAAVEGRGMEADHPSAEQFFDSFKITDAGK